MATPARTARSSPAWPKSGDARAVPTPLVDSARNRFHCRSELTHAMSSRIPHFVLKLLRHLLCLGILFGLAGNGIAVAAPCMFMAKQPPAAMAGMADCAMPADCTDCSAKAASGKSEKRDKGTKPGCMMMAGCATLIATDDPAPASIAPAPTVDASFWTVAPHLDGRELVPEPEPPSLLG